MYDKFLVLSSSIDQLVTDSITHLSFLLRRYQTRHHRQYFCVDRRRASPSICGRFRARPDPSHQWARGVFGAALFLCQRQLVNALRPEQGTITHIVTISSLSQILPPFSSLAAFATSTRSTTIHKPTSCLC